MGHVFHPGHGELHGVTVAVETASGRLVVGRYHEETDRGILLHDAAVHDPISATEPREAWVGRVRKFGIPVAHRHLIIPTAEAVSVKPLRDM